MTWNAQNPRKYWSLQRCGSPFLVADPNGFIDLGKKNFAVTDFSGARSLENRAHGGVNPIVGQNNFELHLGQQINGVFTPAVILGVTFLSSVSAHIGDGHAFDPKFDQCIFHCIQSSRLYYRLNLCHCVLVFLT